jgi:pimeloyl-ACP methyl ester carboxylesterase
MSTPLPVPVPVTFTVEPEGIGPSEIAVWVFPPSPESISPLFPPQWLLCIPGGTYRGLAYFDRQVPGSSPFAYSMARVLAAQGIGSAVIDNLGTGDSPVPASISGWQLTRHVYADAYRQLVSQMRERLANGTLISGLAPVDERRLFVVGVGHSMGGILATQLQASYEACDALCLLGWATLTMSDQEALVDLDANALAAAVTSTGYLPREIRSALHAFFYSPSVPAALIEADKQEAVLVPAGLLECLQPRFLREEAAHIRCPLFLGFASNCDVTAEPQGEVAAYPAARSITLFVQQHAHHCANFEPTRFDLWDEIASWVRLKAIQAKGGVPLAAALQEQGQEDFFATQPLSL